MLNLTLTPDMNKIICQSAILFSSVSSILLNIQSYTVLAKSITYIFYLHCILLVISIIYKFKNPLILLRPTGHMCPIEDF